ncbi:hypothetical protein CHH92_12945 [Bacillus sonorensis]|nr:hypothetical protein CHH92_12945 [Bacillus sonorensis]RHJ05981.1 hypothetical protein DW143_21820 [Bacillus sonorensis]
MNGCFLKRESISTKRIKQAKLPGFPAVFSYTFHSSSSCVKIEEEKIFRQIHVPLFVKFHFKSKKRENQKKTEKKQDIPLILQKSIF